MSNAFDDRRVTIARVRVLGDNLDPLLAQSRLANLIGTVELRPSGLPPSAILCVRKLHDPLPGTLSLAGYAAHAPERWERLLAASLSDIAGHAARPLYEPVPASANAVIFADRAEMLACLALDWAKDTLANRWWWRSLLSGLSVSHAVGSAWLDAPQYIPPALSHLAARGEVALVVGRMDDALVGTLTRLMLSVFNLRDLAAAVEEKETAGASDAYLTVAGEYGDKVAPVKPYAAEASSARLPPPWANHVPETFYVGPTVSRRLLVGIALSLVRDPSRTRTLSFAWETQGWLRAEARGLSPEGIRAAWPEQSVPVEEITLHNEALSGNPLPPGWDGDLSTKSQDPTEHALVKRTFTRAEHSQETVIEQAATSNMQAVKVGSEQRVPATLNASEPAAEAGTPVHTRLGGLFYLLNVAMYLDFYSDYTTPWKKDLDLPVWDFVALVGAELLGGTPPDPVWDLLAELAGCNRGDPPGASFAPPVVWNIDPYWLDAFPKAGVLTWSVDGGRARIRHPSGFLLLDLPVSSDSILVLREMLASYATDFEVNKGAVPAGGEEPPLRRWLGWLMPYIRARLRRALGMNDADDPGQVLCRHDARIFVTLSGVDVMLNLDALPIEIRLAGLDRNPGWLPAAGRTITFHFESKGAWND